MNFAKPENADLLHAAQQSSMDEPEEDGAVTLAWGTEEQQGLSLSAAVEANATELATIEETLEQITTSIDEQREAIAEQNEAIQDIRSSLERLDEQIETGRSERQSHREDIDDLHQRVKELVPIQDHIESIDNRLTHVEKRTASLGTRITRQEHTADRLLAAVFDQPQPCPRCENGQIAHKGGFIDSYTIVCDQCEFEEQISIQ